MLLMTDVLLANGKYASVMTRETLMRTVSMSFLDTETDEKIVETDRESFLRLKRRCKSNIIWHPIELQLRKCLDFVKFEPFKCQPDCFYRHDYYDVCAHLNVVPEWVPSYLVDDFPEDVNNGAKVYYGEYSMENHTPDVIFSNDLKELKHSVYYPAISAAINYDKSGRLIIPIGRTGLKWTSYGSTGYSYEGELMKNGVLYSSGEFKYSNIIGHLYETPVAVLGNMVYNVINKAEYESIVSKVAFIGGISEYDKSRNISF